MLGRAVQRGVDPLADLPAEILFTSDRRGMPDAWSMNPDGSDEHNLTADLPGGWVPDWTAATND